MSTTKTEIKRKGEGDYQAKAKKAKFNKSHGKQQTSSSDTKTVKKDRQSTRKHADIVNDAKRIWNQLRLKTNTPADNRKLMDELMPLITGKCNEIALQHDASRVVQAAMQFGTPAERTQILAELCAKEGNFVELCKSQYAHFCVLKVIKYCQADEACVKLVVKALKGSMAKLAVHAVASRVIESLFLSLPPKQTAILKQEFYGPHFALFAADFVQQNTKDRKGGFKVPTLESNLAAVPDKKEKTLEFVRNLVNKGMEKSLYGLTYFQELCSEYFTFASSAEIRTMAGSSADHAIHLLSTKGGTKVASALIAYGTAKDRKRIMKSLKGYTRSGLLHSDAYLAIIRLVQLTDDTVSIQKNVLNELLSNSDDGKGSQKADSLPSSPLLDVALSDTGSKLLLMLLISNEDQRRKIFDPSEHTVLFPNPTVTEEGKEVSTSKKDPELRRNELLKFLKEPLIELCQNNTKTLLFSKPGSAVLREVYGAFHPPALVEAILGVCQEEVEHDVNQTEDHVGLFEDTAGHLAIKNLILMDASSAESLTSDQLKKAFATVFFSRLNKHMMTIASSNRGAFVVAALGKLSFVKKEVVRSLQPHLKEIKSRAQGSGPTAGYKALEKLITA